MAESVLRRPPTIPPVPLKPLTDRQMRFERRRFGSSDLFIPVLGFGAAALGHMPETFGYGVEEEQALATLREILSGPNFLDTSAIYGNGESERRIGMAIRELGGLPNGFVLSTKADRDPDTGRLDGDQIKRSVEGSLRRLGLDKLQLVFLHDPEHSALYEPNDIFETVYRLMASGGPVEALQKLQQQGVIEHVGISGGPIDLLTALVNTRAFEGVITHNRYTIANQSAKPLIEEAYRQGVAVINAAPFGSGILAKKPGEYDKYAYKQASENLLKRIEQMRKICGEYCVPIEAVALQFSLRDRRVTSTIVGVNRPGRVEDAFTLMQRVIPPGLWQEIKDLASYDDPENDSTPLGSDSSSSLSLPFEALRSPQALEERAHPSESNDFTPPIDKQ